MMMVLLLLMMMVVLLLPLVFRADNVGTVILFCTAVRDLSSNLFFSAMSEMSA